MMPQNDMKIYAGIGSRQTPPAVLARMGTLGEALAKASWTLRSGAAQGADSAFEEGARIVEGALLEVFLPYERWRGRQEGQPGIPVVRADIRARSRDIAAKHHPSWRWLSPVAQAFHARNALQVLGPCLCSPVRMVLCWTPGAKGEGGTGQAIRHARSLGIPVFDLADPALAGWGVDDFEAALDR